MAKDTQLFDLNFRKTNDKAWQPKSIEFYKNFKARKNA